MQYTIEQQPTFLDFIRGGLVLYLCNFVVIFSTSVNFTRGGSKLRRRENPGSYRESSDFFRVVHASSQEIYLATFPLHLYTVYIQLHNYDCFSLTKCFALQMTTK